MSGLLSHVAPFLPEQSTPALRYDRPVLPRNAPFGIGASRRRKYSVSPGRPKQEANNVALGHEGGELAFASQRERVSDSCGKTIRTAHASTLTGGFCHLQKARGDGRGGHRRQQRYRPRHRPPSDSRMKVPTSSSRAGVRPSSIRRFNPASAHHVFLNPVGKFRGAGARATRRQAARPVQFNRQGAVSGGVTRARP